MEIKIVNDGKEKTQSFEASAEADLGYYFANGSMNLVGYGANEAEAKQSLMNLALDMMKELQALLNNA